MSIRPNSIEARDVARVLHPYTNAVAHEQVGPMMIERGDGIYVVDNEGNRYIEGLAGLFCASLGFSEQRLVDAAHRQMQKLPFYHSFGGRSHDTAVELAERLVDLSPVPMSKVFFANSGSEETIQRSSSHGITTTPSAGRPRRRSSLVCAPTTA